MMMILFISVTAGADPGQEVAAVVAADPAATVDQGQGPVEVVEAEQGQGQGVKKGLTPGPDLGLSPGLILNPSLSQSPLRNRQKKIMKRTDYSCLFCHFCTYSHIHLDIYFCQ